MKTRYIQVGTVQHIEYLLSEANVSNTGVKKVNKQVLPQPPEVKEEQPIKEEDESTYCLIGPDDISENKSQTGWFGSRLFTSLKHQYNKLSEPSKSETPAQKF